MKALKDHQKMNGIGATRIRLGLTQEAFAIGLGVSKGTVSRAESGKRSLPAPALLKLAALEIQLAAEGAVQRSQSAPQDWSAAERQALQESALTARERCLLKAAQTQEGLDRMIIRYNKLCDSINKVTGVLTDAGTSEGEPALKAEHLRLHREVLLSRLGKCGPVAQAELRNKVALLYTEAHLHAIDAGMGDG